VLCCVKYSINSKYKRKKAYHRPVFVGKQVGIGISCSGLTKIINYIKKKKENKIHFCVSNRHHITCLLISHDNYNCLEIHTVYSPSKSKLEFFKVSKWIHTSCLIE